MSRATDGQGFISTAKQLPSMKLEILSSTFLQSVSVVKLGEETVFRFGKPAWWDKKDPEEEDYACRGMTAFDVRELFLAAKTPIDGLDFLNRTGVFTNTLESQEAQNWSHHISWTGFIRLQELVRDIMVNGFFASHDDEGLSIFRSVAEDFELTASLLPQYFETLLFGSPSVHTNSSRDIESGQKRLSLWVGSYCSLELVLASIYMDNLTESRFEKCALHRCSNIFEIKSSRLKKYCSQKCAHHGRHDPNRGQLRKHLRCTTMANRRGSGEGSIYQRQDGRWCAQVSLGYKPGGKPHRKLVYGKTRAEVSDAMKRTLRDQQLGLTITSERQTLAQFLTDWLANTVKPRNKQGTYRSYEWIVRLHLIPALGKLQLVQVTPQKLQAFINERQAAGLSAASVKHINATLRAALSQAHRWQLVHQNAAKLITLPRAVRFQPTILTPAQAKALLAFVRGERYEALFTVALTLGLRRGESLGLRWSDVDLDAGLLNVRHSLERVKGEGLRLTEPKSERAKRQLRIPQICLMALLAHRQTQDREREWAGSKWHDGGFVFTTSHGTPLHPDDISRLLPTVLKAAKLPRVRFHDFRHACETLLLSLGVHAKLVQETLGHSSYQLTMDTYSHMIPALRNEVADRMDEVFATTVNEAVKPPAAMVN